MADVSIKLDTSWAKHLDAAVTATLTELGEKMVEESRAIVPVDTGFLRDSIGYQIQNRASNGQFASPVLYFGADADYASHVEYGTVHQAAQPFLRPVVNKARTL